MTVGERTKLAKRACRGPTNPQTMRDAVSISGGFFPPGTSEFDAAGVEVLPSRIVRAPRVKGAPAHLECIYLKTVELPSLDGRQNVVVFGQVVGRLLDAGAGYGVVFAIAGSLHVLAFAVICLAVPTVRPIVDPWTVPAPRPA